MPTQHVNAAELKRLQGGSQRSHQDRVAACLDWFAAHGIVATPISTTGIPVRHRDGSWSLEDNPKQVGFSDIVFCIPPTGRLGLAEVKTGDATRTRSQRELHSRYTAAGALCLVVRGVDDLYEHLGSLRVATRCVSC